MKVIAELSIVPLGTGPSISPYVTACKQVLEETGLVHQMHATGTNIEGEWEEIMAAVRRCHDLVHEMGAPRVLTHLKLSSRLDHDESLADRLQSVEEKLPEEPFPSVAAGFADIELKRVRSA